ncbi:hypothetical protein [Chitinophaga sp. RAB17]|uniref:hypothetical protein n=1 Tax=Chitinophaga sp. RAB17 TaxID=3233049 RepID=UPI003F9341FA
MKYFHNIVLSDYRQRTRTYSFLITLAITVYMAYLFVPLNTATYTTLNVPGFKGAYNSAWVGYVSGIMTTVMLSLYGFLLINSGIKKDIDTEVGLIIASTSITNFGYLLSKQLSNFLVLLTIVGCTFIVNVILFFIRSEGYSFIFRDFILPYLVFAIPAIFLVSALAVVAEVFLVKRNILQFIIYFLLFGAVLTTLSARDATTFATLMDPLGLTTVTHNITNEINTQFQANIKNVSFGFIAKGEKTFRVFVFEGVNWQLPFLLSRLLWISVSIGLVYVSSFFFHRFDFEQTASERKKKVADPRKAVGTGIIPAGINRCSLPPLVTDYSILPFIKIELLLLIRRGNKWLWLINIGLWGSMLLAPLTIAHAYLLPVLLFLQVARWSDLITKEKTNRLHYFTYASYRPLSRILPAQILSAIILAVALALPVILRYAITSDAYAVINILNGLVLIISLAVCIGGITGGKKLYEIVFFLLTYAVLNKVPGTDYLGSIPHASSGGYAFLILALNVVLLMITFIVRKYQLRHV